MRSDKSDGLTTQRAQRTAKRVENPEFQLLAGCFRQKVIGSCGYKRRHLLNVRHVYPPRCTLGSAPSVEQERWTVLYRACGRQTSCISRIQSDDLSGMRIASSASCLMKCSEHRHTQRLRG